MSGSPIGFRSLTFTSRTRYGSDSWWQRPTAPTVGQTSLAVATCWKTMYGDIWGWNNKMYLILFNPISNETWGSPNNPNCCNDTCGYPCLTPYIYNKNKTTRVTLVNHGMWYKNLRSSYIFICIFIELLWASTTYLYLSIHLSIHLCIAEYANYSHTEGI